MPDANTPATAKDSLRQVSLISLRVISQDKRLAVYPFLMVLIGFGIAEGMTALYSYDRGVYLASIIEGTDLAGLVSQHVLAFFLLYSFATQLMVAVVSTYINLAMLTDMKGTMEGKRTTFIGSFGALRRYIPAMVIWDAFFYVIITSYLAIRAVVFGSSALVALIYIPASIPLTYVLLVLFDKNAGPLQLIGITFRRALRFLGEINTKKSASNLIPLAAVFLVFNVFQAAVNLALSSTSASSLIVMNSIIVVLSVVIINAFGLATYYYFKDVLT